MWLVAFVGVFLLTLFEMIGFRLPGEQHASHPPTIQMQPNWEALRTIPMRTVVENAASKETTFLLFDDKRDDAVKAIDEKPAEIRDLLWLTVLAGNMGYERDGVEYGLHTFFFLSYGALAPQVKGALERTGQATRARLFSQAMDLCGRPYPTDNTSRAASFAWSQLGERIDDTTSLPADLNAFDERMLALSKSFGGRDELWTAIGDVIAKSPALTQWAHEARANLSDDDRLNALTARLSFDSSPDGRVSFARWPRPYQIAALLTAFNDEMLNGSVHQFFYNSSGDFAPEVAVAFREVGLTKHADAVERGIVQFKAPYPADTGTRRQLYFNETMDRPFDKTLENLTGDVDDGAIQTALIDLGKRENILPH